MLPNNTYNTTVLEVVDITSFELIAEYLYAKYLYQAAQASFQSRSTLFDTLYMVASSNKWLTD